VSEHTLESLAARVAALEAIISQWTKPIPRDGIIPATRPWETVCGTMEDNEFNRRWVAEILAIRERERRALRDREDE